MSLHFLQQKLAVGRSTAPEVNTDEENSAALFASNHIFDALFSTGLPDNQWQLEVQGWFTTSLARFQSAILEYAYKVDPSSDLSISTPYGQAPGDGWTSGMISALRDQCKNQLIRDAGDIQNFSLLGVLIIASISLLLIGLSVAVPGLLRLIGSRRGWISGPERARQADDKLHLLRLALEGSHNTYLGSWDRGSFDVPVINGETGASGPTVTAEGLTFYTVGEENK